MPDKVHVLVWHAQSRSEVLEVWDDYEVACKRRDKYNDWIDGQGIWRKLCAAINSRRETVSVQTFVINEKYSPKEK